MKKDLLFSPICLVLSTLPATADILSERATCAKITKEYEISLKLDVDEHLQVKSYYDSSASKCYAWIYVWTPRAISERIDDPISGDVLASNVLYSNKPMNTWIGSVTDPNYTRGPWDAYLYHSQKNGKYANESGYQDAQIYIDKIKKLK